MSEYNFGISYIKGKENVVANALSKTMWIFSLVPLKVNLREQVYVLEADGLLQFQGRMYILKEIDILSTILEESIEHFTVRILV
jgi:hypothetical protein